jgi:hypothetical protein
MHDSERYRSNAADCLSEAHDTLQPDHRNLSCHMALAGPSGRGDREYDRKLEHTQGSRSPNGFRFSGCSWMFWTAFSRASNASGISTGSVTFKPARPHSDHRVCNPQSS